MWQSKCYLFAVFIVLTISLNGYAQQTSFCDSIYKQNIAIEGQNIFFRYDCAPMPLFDKKQMSNYFHVLVTDTSYLDVCQYTVWVQYIIDVDSTVKCPIIMKSDDKMLDERTIDRVKKLKFVPARQNGEPIPCIKTTAFYYTLIPHH